MPFIIDVLLQEDSSRGVFGGIRGDCKRGGEIREMEDWLGGECCFQGSKGVVTRAVPGPGMGFFGEVKKGASGVRVVRYESLVEVRESKKGSYVFDC